mmetsp:Transcript_9388/g.28535  ORF Transcript_9388/g.28535 Transcript_9388/m.28535 type:complete len:213 (-) Transcript_9388:1905-2543(-)
MLLCYQLRSTTELGGLQLLWPHRSLPAARTVFRRPSLTRRTRALCTLGHSRCPKTRMPKRRPFPTSTERTTESQQRASDLSQRALLLGELFCHRRVIHTARAPTGPSPDIHHARRPAPWCPLRPMTSSPPPCLLASSIQASCLRRRPRSRPRPSLRSAPGLAFPHSLTLLIWGCWTRQCPRRPMRQRASSLPTRCAFPLASLRERGLHLPFP